MQLIRASTPLPLLPVPWSGSMCCAIYTCACVDGVVVRGSGTGRKSITGIKNLRILVLCSLSVEEWLNSVEECDDPLWFVCK